MDHSNQQAQRGYWAGRGALVTGGSRGLGAALGAELAARGARVVLTARGAPELDIVVQQIRERGGEAHALAADLSNKNEIYPLTGAAAALVGPIEVLFHNASTLGPLPLRLLLDTECEDLADVLELNLLAPFRLSKALAGNMAIQGEGLIVHISSDAAVTPYERWGAYSVSKAALDHLSRLWAQELSEFGVDVLSIDPGEMDTRMHRDALPEAPTAELAKPTEVASAILDYLERGAWQSGERVTVENWRHP
ncbi:MAG TPA: SDR family oxidoreductase [Polyangiaceae bacterium]|nr:SDR family oxidoreductase [Polyangiaceae bacterium]